MMPTVLCLNGPNLDLLGKREPEIYGATTLRELETQVERWGAELGFDVRCIQSNHEGEMVEAIHDATGAAGILLNPGALTHSSYALHDALAGVGIPAVEVHLSNIRDRARWRRRSVVAPAAVMSIFGRGMEGYRAALRHLAHRLEFPLDLHRYGPHPDQVMQVRAGEGTMGAVLLHGGFWLDTWGLDTTESWAVDLARRGVPTANVEYRRMSSGGGPVATTADISRAVSFARDRLGVESLVVIGHSAGGHLATWHTVHSSIPPTMTVAVAGIFDLSAAREDGLGEGAAVRFDPRGSTDLVAAPAPRSRMVLVHGVEDRVVPASQSQAYARHLERLGVRAAVSLVPDSGHFQPLSTRSSAWASILEHLAEVGLPSAPE